MNVIRARLVTKAAGGPKKSAINHGGVAAEAEKGTQIATVANENEAGVEMETARRKSGWSLLYVVAALTFNC